MGKMSISLKEFSLITIITSDLCLFVYNFHFFLLFKYVDIDCLIMIYYLSFFCYYHLMYYVTHKRDKLVYRWNIISCNQNMKNMQPFSNCNFLLILCFRSLVCWCSKSRFMVYITFIMRKVNAKSPFHGYTVWQISKTSSLGLSQHESRLEY